MPPEMALDPEPYRIAVAPIVLSAPVGATDEESLYLATKEDWSEYFVDSLRKMNVATEVTLVPAEVAAKGTQADIQFAYGEGYDLLLRPRLVRANFNYENLSNSAFLSGALWLFTWVGGFFPNDSEYKSDMVVECDAWNACAQLPIQKASAKANDRISLSYFDRNTFFSLGTLESLVVPPFWTHDGIHETSAALTDQGTMQVAADLKRQIRDLAAKAREKGSTDFPIVEFAKPTNGSTVAGNVTDLEGRVVSPGRGIDRVEVFVNRKLHTELRQGRELLALTDQGRPDGTRECRFEVRDLPLPAPDSNEIRVVVTLEKDSATVARTFQLYGPAGKPTNKNVQ
jgi:hypothetical protein